MIVESALNFDSFLATWAFLTFLGVSITLTLSGICFWFYYVPRNVTYEKWIRKSNPKFPTPAMVRDEITQLLKGVVSATVCPAASIWLSQKGYSNAYSEFGKYGYQYEFLCFLGIWFVSDFWEFFYHYLGHKYPSFWTQHKHHHVFYNPSPFAVIADEYLDQFMRATPLLVYPLFVELNMDVLFFTFGAFFYAYGTYLHWGYEVDWLDAHQPIINTSFQHYLHHAISGRKKPYHTGFMFKCWDQLFGTTYDKECFCAKCQVKQGKRTREEFAKVQFYDYSVLLSPSFWKEAPWFRHSHKDGKLTD